MARDAPSVRSRLPAVVIAVDEVLAWATPERRGFFGTAVLLRHTRTAAAAVQEHGRYRQALKSACSGLRKTLQNAE